jgi:hypothetical protein
MFLLDTVMISEPRRPRPAEGVLRFFDREPPAFLYTSVVVLGELRRGAVAQRDSVYAGQLSRWIDEEVVPAFAGRVLDVTPAVADLWGRMRGEGVQRGENLPPIDALIAATALVHGLTVVTRNEADFRRCGAAVRNPWNE